VTRQNRTVQPIAVVIGVSVACLLIGTVGALAGVPDGQHGELTEQWHSDTAVSLAGNHHTPATDGERVFLPVSGAEDSAECRLVAVSASDGTTEWEAGIDPQVCTIHGISDVSVERVDGDTRVLAGSTENAVVAYDPETGAAKQRYPIDSYGYAAPIKATITGNEPELLLADGTGSLYLYSIDGERQWQYTIDGYMQADPIVSDLTGDGESNILATTIRGSMVLLNSSGERIWERQHETPVYSMTTMSTPGNSAATIVLGQSDGSVTAVSAQTGDTVWNHSVGSAANVGPVFDGTGDGVSELFVTTRGGGIAAIDSETQETKWRQHLTENPVQVVPPAAAADVTGDGETELVVTTHTNQVVVINPSDGSVMATYEREKDVRIYASPTLLDTSDDGVFDVYVMYADGVTVALTYTE